MAGTIRPARDDDADAIAAIYAPYVESTHISFEMEPPSEEAVRRRMQAGRAFTWLVHETHGEVDGYAYASTYRDRSAYQWTVETSVYVRADRHRRGIARALMTALLERLAAQGFRGAVANISLPNAASVALFESLGFRPAGNLPAAGFKHGKWWDVGTWHLSLGATDTPPEPLRSPKG